MSESRQIVLQRLAICDSVRKSASVIRRFGDSLIPRIRGCLIPLHCLQEFPAECSEWGSENMWVSTRLSSDSIVTCWLDLEQRLYLRYIG